MFHLPPPPVGSEFGEAFFPLMITAVLILGALIVLVATDSTTETHTDCDIGSGTRVTF